MGTSGCGRCGQASGATSEILAEYSENIDPIVETSGKNDKEFCRQLSSKTVKRKSSIKTHALKEFRTQGNPNLEDLQNVETFTEDSS